METKPFWASKTLWVNAVMLIATVSTAFGFNFGLDAQTQVAVVGAVMGGVNLVLRFMTTSAVGTSSSSTSG